MAPGLCRHHWRLPLLSRWFPQPALIPFVILLRGRAASTHIHGLHSALKMQNDRHEDLWPFSLELLCFRLRVLSHVFVWQIFTFTHPYAWGIILNDVVSLCLIKVLRGPRPSVGLCMEKEAVVYCRAPGNTLPLHWQEAHRLTPPGAQTGGAPYKAVKYLPPDKCVYPPITAYHELAAPGPFMACVHTSAKLQEDSVVVLSASRDP